MPNRPARTAGRSNGDIVGVLRVKVKLATVNARKALHGFNESALSTVLLVHEWRNHGNAQSARAGAPSLRRFGSS
jgi:hypothetical protein